MRLREISPVLVVVVVAALGAGCDVRVGENGVSVDVAGGRARDEWRRTYRLTTGGTFEVTNVNGAIVVDAAPDGQVEVVAMRQTRGSSDEEAQDLLKKLEITEEVSPARVALRTTVPGGTLFGARSVSVEYHLKVPPGLQIVARTENGGVSLHDIDGTITTSTTNGGIRGTNLSGAFAAQIVNGGIVADMARVSGAIELDAVNGGIRLDLPPDLKADIRSSAVNGGVSLGDGLALTGGERTRNRLSGKLNGGGTAVSASTVNGGIRIRARDAAAAAAQAKEDPDEPGLVVVDRKP